MAGWLGLLFVRPSEAHAQDCEPLDEQTFVNTVQAGRQFIDQEDIAGYQLSSKLLTERIPCLLFVPRPEDWASYLIGAAAVAYYRGEDWRTPLTTALHIRPDIDRGVSEDHEIATFVPTSVTLSGDAAPKHVELFVDGTQVSTLPAPSGMHLVQIRKDGVLSSALLVNEPVPGSLFSGGSPSKTAKPDRARGGQIGGNLALGSGVRALTQTVSEPGEFLPDSQSFGLLGAGTAEIWASRPVGLTLDLFATIEPKLDTSLLLTLRGAHLAGGLGAALLHVTHVELEEAVRQLRAEPAALLSASTGALDGRAAVAVGPSVARVSAEIGLSAGRGAVRPRTSLGGRLTNARFTQEGSGRALSTNDWAAMLTMGLSWRAL